MIEQVLLLSFHKIFVDPTYYVNWSIYDWVGDKNSLLDLSNISHGVLPSPN